MEEGAGRQAAESAARDWGPAAGAQPDAATEGFGEEGNAAPTAAADVAQLNLEPDAAPASGAGACPVEFLLRGGGRQQAHGGHCADTRGVCCMQAQAGLSAGFSQACSVR